ncbi:MAG: S8 family serine peptidase [Kiritimatiellae bacterium]|jgi:hypothetical protein|nr:S8 family serine peptidase [Kiritimatiellia bacterium]
MKKTIIILILVFVAGLVYYHAVLSKRLDTDLDGIDVQIETSKDVSSNKNKPKQMTGVIRADSKSTRTPIPERMPVSSSADEPKYISDILSDKIDRQRDAISGERILTFYDENDLLRFKEIAENRGIIIVDSLDSLNSVRIKITDKNVLRKVLRDAPLPIDSGGNYEIYPPNPEKLPNVDSPVVKDKNRRFINALNWIGVDGDNKDWGNGVLVAVLDSEVARNSSLKNAYDKTLHVTAGNESAAHGTFVATIIAGNGNVATGVAPGARILSIDVVDANGKGNTFDIARGIKLAVDSGVKVINISMGSYGDASIVRKAVDYATANNVVIVASTGNDATSVAYPAAYDDVIAVGAVDAASIIADFSNYGQEVDIVAPGIFVETSDPEDNRSYFSGTSASAPFVSGSIAAVLSANPNLSPIQAANLIVDSANDVGVPGDDQLYGAGTLDIGRALKAGEKGIYDLAAGQPSISYDSTVPSLMLFVQNRGTEYIADAIMDVQINGTTTTVGFGGVNVGESVSKELLLDSYLGPNVKIIVVDYEAKIAGQTDVNQSNNRFHAEFQRR